jgi:hypothetical protein
MNAYEAIGWGIFAGLAYYFPIRVYSEKVISKSRLAESAYSPLVIAYFIWYIPIVILLVGAVLFNQLFGCSSVALIAILWAYVGHRWAKAQLLEN